MQTHSTISRAGMLGAASAALLANALPKTTPAADLIPLRIGVPPTDATGQGFYGVDKGFYKDAGLDVTLSTMFNGEALNAALSAGSLDVITGTVVPVAQAFSHGIDERVIAPGLIYDRGQGQSVVIVVNTNSPIKTAADLNGKVVAVNGLGDLTHLAVLLWLGSNGADVKSVKLLEVPFPAVGPALDQGRIDAALLVEPFTTALKGQIRTIGDAMTAIGPRFIGTVWVSKLSWLAQNRDAAARFAAATLKIATWANANHDETAAILARHTNLTVATISTITRAVYDTSPATGALLQPILDAQAKYFGIPRISGNDLIWRA
ncbi:MAG TPA: ABC transporter substrate-binding protein [Candidatus Lustribacter sp.]|nr:ABC transporter substrate-binding protein [Candidatus Lustribacter sp.]